ncbi:UNVERIFIED_CONTAM: putative membrane protein [Brevibacillus sp. OAP136]
MDYWAQFIFKMLFLIALSFGSLLIVITPLIRRINVFFSNISLAVGCLVIGLLFYFLFENPSVRDQVYYWFNRQ